jgi:hypothetical protein
MGYQIRSLVSDLDDTDADLPGRVEPSGPSSRLATIDRILMVFKSFGSS